MSHVTFFLRFLGEALCIQASLPVRMEADQLDRLNGYAVQVRYPGDDPTLEEA
jgi:hypothetical protein